jgi:hypothetical protein
MYTQMDALLAAGEALTRGATVSGVHECPGCGMWHLGQPKPRWRTCQAARKRIYDTESEAREALRKIRADREERGRVNRREESYYRCQVKHGCGRWHLTSWEQEEEQE